jgi:hypothetical protein
MPSWRERCVSRREFKSLGIRQIKERGGSLSLARRETTGGPAVAATRRKSSPPRPHAALGGPAKGVTAYVA